MTDMLSADGRIVRLREVTADDAGSLLDLYHNSSDDSRYKRFLYLGRAAVQEEVDRLTRAPELDHFAILAEDQGQVIGAASYERMPEGFRADFAVLVGDRWQGRGVGTLLVEQLAAHARKHGVQELVGEVLAVNNSMLRVAAGISPGAAVEHEGILAKVRLATDFDSAADEFPDLAFAVVVVGADKPPTHLGKRRAPVFALPEQVMRALGHAVRYADWRNQPLGNRPALPGIDHDRAKSIVDAALADGEAWQSWTVADDLLSCYGVPVLPSAVVDDVDAAVAAAQRLGYPVALKAADPNLVHKTELGAVRLGLADAEAVAHAYRAIGTALEEPQPPVVVQPMRGGGVEMVAGVVHDPLFGSLLMTGLGGIHTDLLADRSLQLLPVTDRDAETMWKRLRGARLLTGYRGSPAADTDALQDVLLRLGRLAEDFPQIAELDLNPLLIFPHGVTAVDVKLRLSPVGPELDPSLRALRAQ
jgi:RimJ/RimL family protein N-acetyltransferase